MRVTLVGCLLALAACGDSSGGDYPGNLSDAPASVSDSASSSDAIAQPGLTVAWVDMPAIPGPFANGVMVTSLKLHLKRLEAVGDGGGTVEQLEFDVQWSAAQQPFEVFLFGAPPAIYSQVSLSIDDDNALPSYEILGTWNDSGTARQFKISDTNALDVDVANYMVTLIAGRTETMGIKVDLQSALSAVNFAMLPVNNMVSTLDQTNTMAITPVRNALATSVFVKTP